MIKSDLLQVLRHEGEALFRFLLSQASTPPKLDLHCKGSHDEVHTRFITHNHNGHRRAETEQYTERVVDFDFKIDVGQHIVGPPTQWSVADSVPAYRGATFRQIGVDDERRIATKPERKAAQAWEDEQRKRGFPPWIGSDYAWREDQPTVMDSNSILRSSWAVRRWADDYCSSDKYLKQFDYDKVGIAILRPQFLEATFPQVVYGWNFEAIVIATRALIQSGYLSGDLYVAFEKSHSSISIRPENRLSRALSNGWVKFLLIITLIYPFLWLFKRFSQRGGGTWKVCGSAYALKRLTSPQPSQAPWYTESPFRGVQGDFGTLGQRSGTSHTPEELQVEGLREGLWFRQWENTIRRAVYGRLQVTEPLVHPDGHPVLTPQALILDGY